MEGLIENTEEIDRTLKSIFNNEVVEMAFECLGKGREVGAILRKSQ